MKFLVCAVHDSAVRAYNTPVFFRTKLEAMRSFRDAFQDQNGQFFKHYADYHLSLIGEYDDGSAELKSYTSVERLISGAECVDEVIFPPDRKLA